MLYEFRLTLRSGSRRVIATCCSTPVFLELSSAHWISLYLHLWPAAARPKPQLRTMVADLADRSALPNDIPNLPHHSPIFYAKLLAVWVAMGFRSPTLGVAGPIEA